MKKLFDDTSGQTSVLITKKYSTSFSLAVGALDPSIRQDIYNIYGFVRVADEIVDSFTNYAQEELLDNFEKDLWFALKQRISPNPILNSFQNTVRRYNIPEHLIASFLKSMRADLSKKTYENPVEINDYIYGSADVVGLMCLQVFVLGNRAEYNRLEKSAIRLGSAFQKINFLRDLKQDFEELQRVYFPSIDPANLTEKDKITVQNEIQADFDAAAVGISQLPLRARFGVYLAYRYFTALLDKISKTPAERLMQKRIRLSSTQKGILFLQAFLKSKFKLI